MDVPTISIPKEQALAAYKQYRQAVRDNPNNKEDRAIMLGYRALAKGRAIINIVDALRAAGLDEQGRPKLAIGMAHWQYAHLNLRVPLLAFAERNGHMGKLRCVVVPSGTFAGNVKDGWEAPRYSRWRALVPMIPPPIRPASALSNYHILWEAVWEAAPPRDPLLLRHLGGYLYAVLAAWNLTELERAVMGARIVQ